MAVAMGLSVEALSTHLVSTDYEPARDRRERPGASIVVSWPRAADEHARAAATLASLAAELAGDGASIRLIDLGGGFPPAPALRGHADAVARALAAAGYDGRLLLEPGRAIVAEAVDLAMTVMAVKELADGKRCLVVDAGTNLLPGAVWTPPRLEAAEPVGVSAGAAVVSGPLCLNVDVLHGHAELPELAPGDLLVARAVGAYNDAQSTQFGEPRPAVVARSGGDWRICRRAEQIEDLVARDSGVAHAAASD
jgi:diaminopimelate decarboxylase